MPDHLHLVVPGSADVRRLRRVLEHHARMFGASWDVAEATRITTRPILARTIRYVLLNPVRDGLVDDPWRWPWSTLRDLGGAIVDPWTRDAVLGPTGGTPLSLERLTVLAGRTFVPPRAADFERPPVASLNAISDAIASTLRVTPHDVATTRAGRRLFVQLALATGKPRQADLASHLRTTTRTLRRLMTPIDGHAVTCALRCLQDERLRMHDVRA